MAVTASAALVSTFAGDAARPGYSAPNMGWNNRVGDPSWIPDIDWYRRVKLEAVAGAGEDVRTVNWEIIDPTLQMKTNADMATAKAGAVASPFGATCNNKDTWTVWATTGVATAAADKYYDTKTPVLSFLRANGQRVQVILGKKKLAVGTTETYTVAAFLPGAGKLPTATTTVVVQAPLAVQLQQEAGPQGLLLRGAPEDDEELPEDTAEEVVFEEAPEEPPEEAAESVEEPLPTSAWLKADIVAWLVEHDAGTEEELAALTKAELLELVSPAEEAPSD